jgi:hypothetical protein
MRISADIFIHLVFKNDKWKENGVLAGTPLPHSDSHAENQRSRLKKHCVVYTACNHDNVPPPTLLAVFSSNNPYGGGHKGH